MNPISENMPPWDLRLPAENTTEELAEMASNAIFSSSDLHTLQLQGLLQQGLVDAMTPTASAPSLLSLTVRIDKPQAFEDLVFDFPEIRAPEFNQQDPDGDTLLHHLARHRTSEDIAPGLQARWRRAVRNFLDVFNTALGWTLRNNEGETATALASRLGKSHLVGIMTSYSAHSTQGGSAKPSVQGLRTFTASDP